MHTLMILTAAFVLLGVCVVVARAIAGPSGGSRGAIAFLPIWFVGAGINLAVGVVSAGYPLSAELPIFLVVFGLPAAVAYGLSRKLR